MLFTVYADGLDYFTSLRFSIAPGQGGVAITIVVFNDNIVEGAEYFNLAIDGPSVEGALLDVTRSYTQVQITDCKFEYLLLLLN